MDITIHGLSPSQRILADVIWHLDSMESVEGFIRSLRPARLQTDAVIAREMIVAAAMDQHTQVDDRVKLMIDNLR